VTTHQEDAVTATTINFEPLQKGLRGSLVTPQDAGYDEARTVYNAMIDRRPAAIARCVDEADIQTCIQFARTEGLTVSVRGGGHSGAGLAVADDALVIDLSPMNSVTVDPKNREVTAGGGATLREVDAAAGEHGLSVPCGIIGSTGVGGLTLGGGIGYLSRQAGLTIDNLLSAAVTLADGSRVTASATENEDLFWAIRGGGGNFGVVSSFRFKAQEVPSILGGPVIYSLDSMGDVLRWYRETLPSLPRHINGWFGILTIPPAEPFPEELWGTKVCAIVWACTLQGKAAEDAMAPLRSFGSPLIDGMMEMPIAALNTAFDALYPAGLQWYWRADFIGEISDDAIRIHEKYAALLPTPGSTMHMYPIDGAVHDVAVSDTAFAYRSAGWAAVIVGVDPDPGAADALREWAVAYQEELHPTALQGAYVNFLMEEGQGRVKASYGPNFERLQTVKKAYDPSNFFHVNQNIPPAG
jgi:FAD/FMN-containing dehydrogenase